VSTNLNLTDEVIKQSVIDELDWLPFLNSTKIGVAVKGGAVMLSGEVDSYPEKLQAERAARQLRGVTSIAEELTVAGAWQSPSDLDIASQATDALERAVNVPDGAVKVSVHEHVVTLSGQLPWHYQQEAAGRAVRYLKGVTGMHNMITLRPTASPEGIRTAIGAALLRSAEVDARTVTVHTTDDGTVRLQGTVRSRHERDAARRAAWFAPGVTDVVDDLQIRT
jgi:osmotically-inducible protein OsmY